MDGDKDMNKERDVDGSKDMDEHMDGDKDTDGHMDVYADNKTKTWAMTTAWTRIKAFTGARHVGCAK